MHDGSKIDAIGMAANKALAGVCLGRSYVGGYIVVEEAALRQPLH